jgi:hypothetical protein
MNARALRITQAGHFGIYGDFLFYIAAARDGASPIELGLGPTIGPLLEMAVKDPIKAAQRAADGKETHLLAEEARNVKGFIPGSNIWYAKAALDHLIFQQVMEALSPGYLANIRSRTMRYYQQDWWWSPGEEMPSRGPDLEKMFGG